jgi:hypothetical protein
VSPDRVERLRRLHWFSDRLSQTIGLVTYPDMSITARAQLEDEVQSMVDDRFPEGLVRMLAGDYPAGTHGDYEDAVATGFEKLVASERKMENPRGFVTTVAINAMRRTLRRAALQQLAGVDSDDGERDDLLDRQIGEWTDPTAEQAAADDAYEFMQTLVGAWESRNIKTTTRLVLTAASIGEALSSEELAQRLEDQLGQDVSASTARQWRKRGLDRLRRELIEADLLEETEK